MDIKQVYQHGYDRYNAGRYGEAERVFRLLTTLAPKQMEFWMALGSSLQLQKKYKDAFDCYGAASLLDAEQINPYVAAYTADCLWALDDKKGAGEAIESALAIAEKDKKHEILTERLKFLKERWKDERY